MAQYPGLSKATLAKRLGVSRSSLYYQPKRPAIDLEVKSQIESVLSGHPSYGHKRIALELKLNKKRILRVMNKFGIKPYKRRPKKPFKKQDQGKPANQYQNLIEGFCPITRGVVWVADFTYIRYQERFIYLATIMDLYTREIVGFNISRFHNQELVLGALEQALAHHPPPLYFHSDQGTEYGSQAHIQRAEEAGMMISMSHKASPWENGRQESFYSQFKLELGDANRFESLGELIEEICRLINYYNTERIHTALKMPPAKFSRSCRLRV